MNWSPATIKDVARILEQDLANCTEEQLREFEKHATRPYRAPLLRYGKLEDVVVVARKNDEVIYWEDVEEGFNVSAIAPNGTILEHYCNQDPISLALNRWITASPNKSRSMKLDRTKTQLTHRPARTMGPRSASLRLAELGGSEPDLKPIPRRRPS